MRKHWADMTTPQLEAEYKRLEGIYKDIRAQADSRAEKKEQFPFLVVAKLAYIAGEHCAMEWSRRKRQAERGVKPPVSTTPPPNVSPKPEPVTRTPYPDDDELPF